MIEVEAVDLAYGEGADRVEVLAGIDFRVQEGASCAIIGPSGCGKSSLLLLLAGLLYPSAGKVQVVDRRHLATMLQQYGLLPWKTVAANIGLGLQLRGMPRTERSRRVAGLLDEMGLAGFAHHFPGQLSGGMQQRVALARALAVEPRILLMDEPLSALDALTRERLQNLLLDVWRSRRITTVLVTHSIEEAVFLGQTILVLSSRPGRLVACVDNPGAGHLAHRQSSAFFQCCNQLRNLIREECRGGD